MRRITATTLLTVTLTAGAGLTGPAPATASGPVLIAAVTPRIVVNNLNNPRQLVLLGGRTLLVAEAGSGGPACADGSCLGLTGSVALVPDVHVLRPTKTRIIRGLLSSAGPDGTFAVGADGVGARSVGQVYVAMTYAPPEALPPSAGEVPSWQLGRLLLSWQRHTPWPAADITAVETAQDPDGNGADSNPYSVLVLPNGRELVADAAGNDIIEVRGSHTRVWAVLPDHDNHQAVPTSLALGPGGQIRVGELNAENPGTARVYTFARDGGNPTNWIGGFTAVTGIAYGPDSSLWVSELFGGEAGPTTPPGQVTRVAANGARSTWRVPFPAGIAVGPDGHVYVSAWSVSDADGGTAAPGGVHAADGGPIAPGQIWELTP
jgi:hypothetical protein